MNWLVRLLRRWLGVEHESPYTPKPGSEVRITSDLDALIAEPIAFKLFDKTHFIRPMDTKTFFRTCERYQQLLTLTKEANKNEREFVEMYGDFFASVCSTVGRAEVAMMTMNQVASLTQLVYSAICGRAQGEAGKKKTVETESHPL